VIDIHCHLLPGIDDGATTIEQSLALARYAVADGITHMVVTPHIQVGAYDNNLATISAAFELFVSSLEEAGIELNVAMAAEIRLCPEILPILKQGNLPLFISPEGKQALLLELPHSHVPPGTEQALKCVLAQDIGVVIVHPERNKEIMLDYNKVKAFIDLGCMLQLTSGSVSGRFGKPPRMAAEYMLQHGWVDLLASDAHNLQHRPPQLSDGKQAAAAIIGEDRAHELVFETPWKIVGGMFGSSGYCLS
jgi:protein-tyrosine phosphatase